VNKFKEAYMDCKEADIQIAEGTIEGAEELLNKIDSLLVKTVDELFLREDLEAFYSRTANDFALFNLELKKNRTILCKEVLCLNLV